MLMPDVRGFFHPATATWTYVVWVEAHADHRCAVIDSVLDFDFYSCSTHTQSADCIIRFIQEKKLELEWILETHIHADHLTAAQYLKKELGGKTAISKHILTVLQAWQSYFHNETDTALDGSQFDYLFSDNEKFTIGPLEAEMIHTPGHTPADTTYVIGDALFVGDSMFLPDVGSGRCDFPGGSAEDSYASSRLLYTYPDQFRMYVGHDYPPDFLRGPQCMSTVLDQKTANERLRLGIAKEDFIARRREDDQGKAVPQLLLPAIQVNLRCGGFGDATQGIQYIKLPLNLFK